MGTLISGGNPNFNELKLTYSGQISISKGIGETQGYGYFEHGLGYKPAFLAYWTGGKRDNIYYPTPYNYIDPNGRIPFKVDVVATETLIQGYLITQNFSSPNDYYNKNFDLILYFYIFKKSISSD